VDRIPRISQAQRKPHFGFTRRGLPVHQRTLDHLPAGNPTARFNAWLAVKITKTVGSMWCAYVFAGIALYGLPGALRRGGEGAVSWIAQTFLQLVLLSIIIVGQDVQTQASDARAAKTFEDVEALKSDVTVALDRLDEKTAGGMKAVLDAVNALSVPEVLEAVRVLGTRLDSVQSGEAGERLQRKPRTAAKPDARTRGPV
jgi:hypothetical protein